MRVPRKPHRFWRSGSPTACKALRVRSEPSFAKLRRIRRSLLKTSGITVVVSSETGGGCAANDPARFVTRQNPTEQTVLEAVELRAPIAEPSDRDQGLGAEPQHRADRNRQDNDASCREVLAKVAGDTANPTIASSSSSSACRRWTWRRLGRVGSVR